MYKVNHLDAEDIVLYVGWTYILMSICCLVYGYIFMDVEYFSLGLFGILTSLLTLAASS